MNEGTFDGMQDERGMLEVLMSDRQKLLADLAAVRRCLDSSLCSACRQPITGSSCASSAAA